MDPLRTALRNGLVLSLATSVAVACAHGKANVELSAQAGEPTEPPAEAAPVVSSTPVAEAPGAAPASPQAPTQTAPLYDYPACPLECRILRPHLRALTADEKERIRGAIAPTMSGLKSCIYGAEAPGAYVHPPPVNLRFNDQGDLVDLGVDSQGYEANLEACFQSLAHGQSAMPVVKLDSGAATVLCAEVCPRPQRAKAGTKKRK